MKCQARREKLAASLDCLMAKHRGGDQMSGDSEKRKKSFGMKSTKPIPSSIPMNRGKVHVDAGKRDKKTTLLTMKAPRGRPGYSFGQDGFSPSRIFSSGPGGGFYSASATGGFSSRSTLFPFDLFIFQIIEDNSINHLLSEYFNPN
jgi:hypothetical protein